MVICDKEIRFKRSPLDVYAAVFIFVAALSAIFSADRGSSVFGFYGRFSDGLIGLFCLGIFYFLIVNHIEDVGRILKIFLCSAFLVVLSGYFSILGFWQEPTFNPVAGSLEGLAVFLAVIAVLLAGLIFQKSQSLKNWSLVIGHWLLLFAILGLLILIFFSQLPEEQILSQGLSWRVAFETVTDHIKEGFLGSGIGTYFYDFAKHKPAEFNQSQLWQIRFDRSGNHISEILSTMGFLGLLSYLLLIGMFLSISWFALKAGSSISKFQMPLSAAFLALLVGQLVYYQNTVLAFVFWLFLALSAVSWEKPIREKVISLKESPKMNLVFSAGLVIVGLLILTGFYFAQKFYRADMAYAKTDYEKAVSLNPDLSQYRITLSRVYLEKLLLEMKKPSAKEDSLLLQNNIAEVVNEAKTAVILSPNRVAGWETLGMAYREIHPIVKGAGELGVKAFERAIALEPTNPVIRTELGKLYLALDELEKAKIAFAEARELKPDYLEALLQEVLVYEEENNLAEAVKKIEELNGIYPLNPEILFQLGRLYFNSDKIDEAIAQFEKAVELSPDYSNALYSLGVAYSKDGQKEKAISAFEKVLELNPGNQDVIEKIKELKK